MATGIEETALEKRLEIKKMRKVEWGSGDRQIRLSAG